MNRCSEYRSIVEVLELAVSSFDTYHDKYIKVIVKDAKLLELDPRNRGIVDRRVYAYSATLSKMPKKKLSAFNPDALTRKDFQELLAYFSSL